MYYQSSAIPDDPSEPESDRLKTLLDNLNNLRGKLKNFTVIDELGQPIGEISDLILDAGHQLNLVIAQPDAQARQTSVLLNGRRIKKVSVQTQSVFVDITKADARLLPEYFLPDASIADSSQPQPSSGSNVSYATTTAEVPNAAPPAVVAPDFSLDVMESPSVAPSTTHDDFLAVEPSETAAFADLNLSDSPNDLDFTDLELPQATGELNDLDFTDLELSSAADDRNEFELDLPTQVDEPLFPEPVATTPALELSGFEPVGEEPVGELDEWAEFDRIMSADPTEALDLAMESPVFAETDNPLPELDFAADPTPVGEFTSTTDAHSQATAEPPESSSLPELNFADAATTTAADPLAALNFEDESEADPLPELSFDESDRLPDLDLTLEDSLPELSFEDMGELPSLDIAAESELPELSFESEASLPDLDLPSESTISEESPINELDPSLADLDFGFDESESLNDLDDLTLTTDEAVAPLDFSLDEPQPAAALVGDSDAIAFTEETQDTDSELEAISSLADLDFTPEATPNEATLTDFDLPTPALEPESAIDLTLNDADFALSNETDTFADLDLGESLEFPASSAETEPDLDFTDSSELLSFDEPEAAFTSELPNIDHPEATELDFSQPVDTFSTDTFSLEQPETETEDLNVIQSLDFGDFNSPDSSFDLNLDDQSQALLDLDLAEPSTFSTFDLDEAPLPTPDLESLPLDLDAVELSSAPLESSAEVTPSVDPSSFATEPTSNETEMSLSPEFGLASIPAQTYDLSDVATGSGSTLETNTTDADPLDVLVPLLEERLKVEYERRKVGEVIVRKRIETRMIQVPVQYEKLVIEQVGDDSKVLAEVDLSQGLDRVDIPGVTGKPLVSGEFKSPRTASHVLDAIAKTLRHRCKNVRIEIELEDPKLQQAYQDWLNQCSKMP